MALGLGLGLGLGEFKCPIRELNSVTVFVTDRRYRQTKARLGLGLGQDRDPKNSIQRTIRAITVGRIGSCRTYCMAYTPPAYA